MSSNIKPRNPSKDSPTEPFKRAVTGCLRAIARKPELEVAFAAERPGIVGGKARLPEPPRKLSGPDAAIVRGHADSIALKLACHDPLVHRKLVPSGQQARAVFEAVEQARVEAIGARRMSGVAKNLSAMLDDRFHRGKFDQVTDRADAPIEEAVALMVRERLTGQAPPPAAKKIVDLWRPLIEDRAGRDLDRLERLIENQARFGDAIHDLLDALDMGEDRSTESDEEEGEEGEQDRRKEESGEDGQGADSEDTQTRVDEADVAGEDMSDSTAEAADALSAEMADDAEMGDAESPAAPPAPARPERAARAGLPALHHQTRRDGRGRGFVRTGGARSAARLPRQAALASARRGRAARQPTAAPFDGTTEPRLGVRPGRGIARSRAALAHRGRSAPSALVQAREGNQFPRYRGHAPARQFGLDARTADHGRGDLRRYPGAHARALRRQSGNSGLYHARVEGRAIARGLARRRQARQSGAAQRSSPHHLQVGGRALASRPQKSRSDDARRPAQGEYRWRSARLGAQAAAGPYRAAQDLDDDFRWRAGRRFHAIGQSRQLSGAALALGDRGYRDALAGGVDRDRHRSRRHTLLPPRRHHRRCRGTRRRHDRKARRAIRGAIPGRTAPAAEA